MKKFLLISFLFTSIVSYAQNKVYNKAANVTKTTTITAYDGNEFLPLNQLNQTVNAYPARLSLTQTVLGSTYYDLQSNASTDDRMVRYGNNELSATWTMGMDYQSGFPDRGTGYNYFDGSSWLAPTATRIEPKRTGWPSIAVTASGKEHNIAHTSGTDSLVYSHRPVAGNGAWNFTILPPLTAGNFPLWPRITSGGLNGNSLHMISITTPVANSGTLYQGIDGALIYSRSQNDGVTWDKLYELLPGIDTTTYKSMGADAYAIHARGNTIAILSGGYFIDWALWKSTDNGDTWTQTIIHDFPFPAYDLSADGSITDLDGDGVGDLVPTTDGKVAVLVDHTGMVHAWAGALEVMDNDATAGQNTFSWQPYYDALIYWNESFGAGTPPDTIASTLDLDGDGVFTFATDSIPFYRGSMTTQASVGIDATGNLYVAYMSPVENTTSGSTSPGILNDFNYRNVYLKASPDGGVTWNDPINVTNDDFFEGVYPVIPKNVAANCVDIIWQQDSRPDIAAVPAAGNPLHPFDLSNINQIIHDCIPTQLLLGVKENINNISNVSVYPNPATEMVKINYSVAEATGIRVEILNTLGQSLMVQNYKAVAPGIHTMDVDVSSLPAGIYFINSIAGGQNIASKLVKR
ncbi:MAG: T9SS type A sorting domain-containing protein [Bacteroidia bacterium]